MQRAQSGMAYGRVGDCSHDVGERGLDHLRAAVRMEGGAIVEEHSTRVARFSKTFNQAPRTGATPLTLLFLTSGPYFWVNQRTARLKYELLSRDFDGYILSFVSRKEWRRATIGRFELFGCRLSGRVHGIASIRLVIRVVFTIGMGLYLHLFRKRLHVIITYDPFLTGLLGYILKCVTGAKLVVEVNNDFASPDNWRESSEEKTARVKAAAALRVAAFVMSRSHRVKLLFPTQVEGFYRPRRAGQVQVFHD